MDPAAACVLLALSLALGSAGCGGGEPRPAAPPAVDAAVGTWTIERVEVSGKRDPSPTGKFTLELKPDGTYLQALDVATMGGTWTRSGARIALVTKTHDGHPLPADSAAEETTDTVELQGDTLVMTDGETKFFLKRK